jgi:hypothetical protein
MASRTTDIDNAPLDPRGQALRQVKPQGTFIGTSTGTASPALPEASLQGL